MIVYISNSQFSLVVDLDYGCYDICMLHEYTEQHFVKWTDALIDEGGQ